MNNLYDITARRDALLKEQAETLRKFEAEVEVLEVLPPNTPATLKFIYTHGLDRPLYGASLGLGFKVKTLAEIPDIIVVFPPVPASYVEHGSATSPYRSFWPNTYAGLEPEAGKYSDQTVHKRVNLALPAWYELEEYGEGHTTEKVKWYIEMRLRTLGLRTVRVDCEVEGGARSGAHFSRSESADVGYGRSRGLRAQSRYPVGLPKGERFGTYGHLRPDVRPSTKTYWPGPTIETHPQGIRDALRDVLGLKVEGAADEKGTMDGD